MLPLQHIAEKKDYEKTEYVLRRHWIILMRDVFFLALEIILPILIVFALSDLVREGLADPVFGPAMMLFASGYILFVWLLFFHNFIDYYLDTWMVTNERIVHIEQIGFFARTQVEIRFFRIQDVASEVEGLWGTLFGYGTVHVQSAGESARYVMKQVPNAHEVARHVHRLIDTDRQYHKDRDE
jgi:uncharacterized membrane protein YdbT with pleckstrin-like domain